MQSKEIVRKAIEFDCPPRLPFFLGGVVDHIQELVPGIPNDLCDCFEMDRQQAGWFFDNPEPDDWGCGWAATEQDNMGQVVHHPLTDFAQLSNYRPPDPRNSFYFDRLEDRIAQAEDRYVMVTSHFNLIERLHMLHGFEETLVDLYCNPQPCEKVLDMVLDFKVQMFDELHRRFGDGIHGLWLTDDWGTQQNTYIAPQMFRDMFLPRYKVLAQAIHDHGWHFHLHSCGRVNDFVPMFIEAGIDVLNMQQPQAYGIEAIGKEFAGKICFQTTADIQATLPQNDPELVKQEVEQLVHHWSRREGGFIVFNYGHSSAIGVDERTTKAMFEQFHRLAYIHNEASAPTE